jgi:hypothetical protein
VNRHRIEDTAKVLILLAIGVMAGAAAFTHVHDLTVAHGQPDWIGWANAVAVELMAIYLGLEIRTRRRAGQPVGFVGVLLVAFAALSLAAQVAEAEPSVWGWTVAAVPSLAFLALVKVVLSSTPTTDDTPAPAVDELPTIDQPTNVSVPEPEPVAVPVPLPPRPASSAVLPPLGVVRPDRPRVVGIAQ